MIELGHFMLGICFGFLILLLVPMKKKIQQDILVLGICGFWAMIPDIPALWGDFTIDDTIISNIFFFHGVFDTGLADIDLIIPAVITAIAILLWLIYSGKMKILPRLKR